MARIMISRKLAALVASLGIGLSGLSFSAPASASPTCEAQMFHRCNQNNWWQTVGYTSFDACFEHQVATYCPPPEYAGQPGALKLLTRV